MDDRLGLEPAHDPLHDVPVREVAVGRTDLLAGPLAPRGDPLGQRCDRGEGVGARLGMEPPAQTVVDDVDVVAAV